MTIEIVNHPEEVIEVNPEILENMKRRLAERPTKPAVGVGVTVRLWSDQITFTIVEVSASGKSFLAVEDEVRANKAGGYLYIMGKTAPVRFNRTKDGRWSVKGNKAVLIGERRYYQDPSF